MLKTRLLVALLPLLFLLTACPYSADFPLDSPSQRINKDILGTWLEEGGDAENPNYFTITDLGNNTYQFEKNEYNTTDKKYDASSFSGHLTKVGNVTFLNLQKKGETNYLFFKINIAADHKSFVLFEVTDNIDEKFSNSNELKAFFDKHKDLSFFYNKDEKTYKKK